LKLTLVFSPNFSSGQQEIYTSAMGVIIITKDRGFTNVETWDEDFTAGVIFINLPDDIPASSVNAKII
jgi:hypothetical protein